MVFIKGQSGFKGRRHDLEYKKMMSKKKLGIKRSDEDKKKISEGRKGMKFTEKHRYNISLAGKGKRLDNKNPFWKDGNNRAYRHRNPPRPKPEQCDVCGAFGRDFKRGLCYDHDHKTGKFRGWLCMRCNIAIGMVKDNIEILIALAEYIKRNKII